MNMIDITIGVIIGGIVVYFFMNFQLQKYLKEKIHLEANLNAKNEASEELSKAKELLSNEFKVLASEILEKDRNDLENRNIELLSPLHQQIKDFRDKLESLNEQQIEGRASLVEQIESLKRVSIDAQQTTQDLTNALTYDNKKQGDWGELVLSSILSSSGLREGYEFHTQKKLENVSGQVYRPDVVLHLPDGKDIIIDSKVSIKAYKEYVADQSNVQKLDEHIKSIENHINGISIKEYEKLEGVNTLDFIFVFIRIESALLVALGKKPEIFTNALKKNIVLVSPSTLMMSLKTVHHIWQTERQNKNSEEIARQAGAMYDKLFGFLESMDSIEKSIDKAQKSYKDARNKLSEGTGNLIGRAEKLKELGIQSKKELK